MGHLSAVGYRDTEPRHSRPFVPDLETVFGFFREPYLRAVQSLELNEERVFAADDRADSQDLSMGVSSLQPLAQRAK